MTQLGSSGGSGKGAFAITGKGDVSPMLVAAAIALAVLFFQSPRSAALVMALASAVSIAALLLRAPNVYDAVRHHAPSLGLLAFAGFAFLSVVWSADRIESGTKPLFLALMVVGAGAIFDTWRNAGLRIRKDVCTAALIALAIGLALAACESVTDQVLSKAIYTAVPSLQKSVREHIRVENGIVTFLTETNFKRRIGLFTLLVWPALLAAACAFQGRVRIMALAAVAALALIMIFIGPHQSSWFAGVASVAVFALALVSASAARRFVALGFAAWVLLALPLVWGAYKLELHKASWVPHSARHRVVIWNTTANEVLKSPLLGIGAGATRKIFENAEAAAAGASAGGGADKIALNRHAHNAYVQIWYELGAVGALLLAVAGIMIVNAARHLPKVAEPFAYAQFAATAAVMSSSYGIWQMWFQASIAMGAVALLCASALMPDRPRTGTTRVSP